MRKDVVTQSHRLLIKLKEMNNAKVFLTALPSWILSLLTAIVILWLTLSPDPLGDDAPRLFPGADKVVHAMMFGFLAIMILLDRQRKDGWRTLSVPFIFLGAALSILMGVGIEVAQLKMDMGRGYEVADMVADAVGVAICSLSWILLQHRWSNRS